MKNMLKWIYREKIIVRYVMKLNGVNFDIESIMGYFWEYDNIFIIKLFGFINWLILYLEYFFIYCIIVYILFMLIKLVKKNYWI